jgi:hypothetical protein
MASRLLALGGYGAALVGVLCLIAGLAVTALSCGFGACVRTPEFQLAVLGLFGLGIAAILAGGSAVMVYRIDSDAR